MEPAGVVDVETLVLFRAGASTLFSATFVISLTTSLGRDFWKNMTENKMGAAFSQVRYFPLTLNTRLVSLRRLPVFILDKKSEKSRILS